MIDTVVPGVVRSWWLGWQGLVMNASCRTESINGNVHASFGRLTAEYTVWLAVAEAATPAKLFIRDQSWKQSNIFLYLMITHFNSLIHNYVDLMCCQLFLDMLITERFPPVGIHIIVVYLECDCKYRNDDPHQARSKGHGTILHLRNASLSNKGKPRIAEGCSCEAVGVVFVKLIRVNPNRCQHRHV